MSDPARFVRSILRSTKISKFVFAAFAAGGSGIPFLQYAFQRDALTLVTAVILSLAISLAYFVVYSLQVLPSFSSAEPYAMLSALPLSNSDFALVSLLSFFRTFDLIAIASIVVPAVAIALLTFSVFATIAIALASIVNVIFAISIGLWFSSLFYRNYTRAGRSKSATVFRLVFLISWGFAVLSFSLFFNFIRFLLPYLSNLISNGLSNSASLAFLLIHPFPVALLVASMIYPSFLGSAFSFSHIASYAASFGYVCLAAYFGRWTIRSVSSITKGGSAVILRRTATEFLLRLRRPLLGYVFKDLRVASKNPQSAFLFVLPLFETIIIAVASAGISRATEILGATATGCFFTIFLSSVLLTTESTGLDYTLSLPLGSRTIINSKSIIATIAFTPVPLTILVIAYMQSGLLTIPILIPFLEILAVSAATTAEISFFITSYKRRSESEGTPKKFRSEGTFQPKGFSLLSASDLLRLAKAVGVAIVLLAAPLIIYGIIFELTFLQSFSILGMFSLGLGEMIFVQLFIKRSAFR
jgi:predicted permease